MFLLVGRHPISYVVHRRPLVHCGTWSQKCTRSPPVRHGALFFVTACAALVLRRVLIVLSFVYDSTVLRRDATSP